MTPSQIARDLLILLYDVCKDLNYDGRRIVANRIRDGIRDWWTPEKPKAEEPLVPMTDAEAKRFRNEIVPFGAFKGDSWREVPIERLAWYADTARENWRDLWRYLNSDRVKREAEENK